jgi:hypothetical protein
LLPSGGFFVCELPTLALQLPQLWQSAIKTGKMMILPGITTSWTRNQPKGYSAGNYQLRNKESSGGMWFRRKIPAWGIQWKNRFRRKLPAYWRGINPKNGIPTEIDVREKIIRTVTISGSPRHRMLKNEQIFRLKKENEA